VLKRIVVARPAAGVGAPVGLEASSKGEVEVGWPATVSRLAAEAGSVPLMALGAGEGSAVQLRGSRQAKPSAS
jgi:hypothetical protein